MWLMLNDCFLSIVNKDCPTGSLLVRARRPGDIEKVFGRRTRVTRSTDSDYLFRATIRTDDVTAALQREVMRVDYGNFKNSVTDIELHDAYLRVWTAMSNLQDPPPYSGKYMPTKGSFIPKTHEEIFGNDGFQSTLPNAVKLVAAAKKKYPTKKGGKK